MSGFMAARVAVTADVLMEVQDRIVSHMIDSGGADAVKFGESEVASLADFGVWLMSRGSERTRRDLGCDALVADIISNILSVVPTSVSGEFITRIVEAVEIDDPMTRFICIPAGQGDSGKAPSAEETARRMFASAMDGPSIPLSAARDNFDERRHLGIIQIRELLNPEVDILSMKGSVPNGAAG